MSTQIDSNNGIETDTELEYNAYHMAAIAVARIKGKYTAVPDEISIAPDESMIGYVKSPRDFTRTQEPDYKKYQVVCKLSGRTAERKLLGVTTGMSSSSRDSLKEARVLLKEIALEANDQRQLMKDLERESVDLIDDNWPLVSAIASALKTEEVIDHDRILEIVRQVDPDFGNNISTHDEMMARYMSKASAA